VGAELPVREADDAVAGEGVLRIALAVVLEGDRVEVLLATCARASRATAPRRAKARRL